MNLILEPFDEAFDYFKKPKLKLIRTHTLDEEKKFEHKKMRRKMRLKSVKINRRNR